MQRIWINFFSTGAFVSHFIPLSVYYSDITHIWIMFRYSKLVMLFSPYAFFTLPEKLLTTPASVLKYLKQHMLLERDKNNNGQLLRHLTERSKNHEKPMSMLK